MWQNNTHHLIFLLEKYFIFTWKIYGRLMCVYICAYRHIYVYRHIYTRRLFIYMFMCTYHWFTKSRLSNGLWQFSGPWEDETIPWDTPWTRPSWAPPTQHHQRWDCYNKLLPEGGLIHSNREPEIDLSKIQSPSTVSRKKGLKDTVYLSKKTHCVLEGFGQPWSSMTSSFFRLPLPFNLRALTALFLMQNLSCQNFHYKTSETPLADPSVCKF